jgi:hypothetical protein
MADEIYVSGLNMDEVPFEEFQLERSDVQERVDQYRDITDGTVLSASTTDSTYSSASVASVEATAIVFINADPGDGYITAGSVPGDILLENLDLFMDHCTLESRDDSGYYGSRELGNASGESDGSSNHSSGEHHGNGQERNVEDEGGDSGTDIQDLLNEDYLSESPTRGAEL